MSRDEVREALLLLEETEEASTEFRADLLRRFLEEASPEAPPPAPEIQPEARGRRRWWLRPRMSPALAALVVLALLATFFVVLPRPRTAYAVLRQARAGFTGTPFHATMRNVFGEALGDDTLVTEIWFRSETQWRSTIKSSSNPASPEGAGDFTVYDGKRFGRYEAAPNTFFLQPASEIMDPYSHSGVAVHDPTSGEWLTATGLKPTAQFLNENCQVGEDRIADREAERLSCDSGSAGSTVEVSVWLDRETGLILKIVTPELVREFLTIEYDPEFPPGILDVTGPEGATITGEAAVRSTAAPELDAVIQAGEVVWDIAVGLGAVWVLEWNGSDVPSRPREPGSSPPPETVSATSLKRIDPTTNRVVASIPLGSSSPGSIAILDGYLWVATHGRVPDSSFLLRLDPNTNQFVGSPISLELGNAQLVASRDALWVAYTVRPTLEKVDPKSGKVVARINFEGDTYGRPVFGGGSVWVFTQEEKPANHYINRIYRVDATTDRILAAITGKGNLSFGEGALWTLCCATGEERSVTLSRIDPADNRVTSMELPPGANELAAGAGFIWITDADDRTIIRVDPGTLRVVADPIGVGAVPSRLAISLGAVWVGSYEEGTVSRINLAN